MKYFSLPTPHAVFERLIPFAPISLLAMASFVFAPPLPPTEQFFKFDESETFVIYIRQFANKLYQEDASRVYAMNVANQLNNEPSYEMARVCSQELVKNLYSGEGWEKYDEFYEEFMPIFDCFYQNIWFHDCFQGWKLWDYFFLSCTSEEQMHIQMCADMAFYDYMRDDLYYEAHRNHFLEDIKNVLNSKVFNHLYIDVLKKTENDAQKMLLAFVNIFLHARSVVIDMRNNEMLVDGNYTYKPLFEEIPVLDECRAVENGFQRYRVLEPIANRNQGYENDGDENEDFPLPPQEGQRDFDLEEARRFVDQVLREYREEQEEARINDNSDLDEDLDPIPILE